MCDKKDEYEEKMSAYCLANMKGIGNRTIFKLLEVVPDAKAILGLQDTEVKELLGEKKGELFLQRREECLSLWEKRPLVWLEKEKGLDFVPFTSKAYPDRLRHIPSPPFCLYVKGKLPKEERPAVAIIGARACSEYGKMVASIFGKHLGAAGIQIISGMARGIDGIAQRGALNGGGETYAVLGCGADICYPPDNMELYRDIRSCGGILSEYPPGTEAQSSLFPQRNRIISGLADLLLVIEARKRSGTYITVTQALEQGKEVFAVPGRITDGLSDGCNYLLTQGAGVAVSPESIIEELRSRFYTKQSYIEKENKQSASETEKDLRNIVLGERTRGLGTDINKKMILSCMDITPLDIQSIYERVCRRKNITMQELLYELTKLQIEGLVIGEGNYYKLMYAL